VALYARAVADAVLDGKANATQELTQAVVGGEGDEFVEVNEGA
jgi:small subunit ribosomal protein S2